MLSTLYGLRTVLALLYSQLWNSADTGVSDILMSVLYFALFAIAAVAGWTVKLRRMTDVVLGSLVGITYVVHGVLDIRAFFSNEFQELVEYPIGFVGYGNGSYYVEQLPCNSSCRLCSYENSTFDFYMNATSRGNPWVPPEVQAVVFQYRSLCCSDTAVICDTLVTFTSGHYLMGTLLQAYFASAPLLDLVTAPVTLMLFQFSFAHYVATLALPATTFVAVVGLDLYMFANVGGLSSLTPLYMLVVGIFVYTSCVLSVRSYTRLQRAQFSLYHALKVQSTEFRHDAAQRGYRVALEANRTLLGNNTEDFGKMAHSVKTTTI